MALRHPGSDLLLEAGQPGGLLRRCQLLEVRRPIGIDAELGVGREAGIGRGGERRQLGPQRGGEVLAPFGDAECGAVGRQLCLALCPGQEPGAIVGEGLGADGVEVAGLQGVGQVDEHAHPQRPPVERVRLGPTLGDERLPALGREAEVDVALHLISAGMAVAAHDGQRVQQAAVLGRRLHVHQVEQPEQQGAVSGEPLGSTLGVGRPEQRQVVAAVPGGHSLAPLRQGRDAVLFKQELPDLVPEDGIRVLRLLGLQHLAARRRSGSPRWPDAGHARHRAAPWRQLGCAGPGGASSRSARRGSACRPGAAARAAGCAACRAG